MSLYLPASHGVQPVMLVAPLSPPQVPLGHALHSEILATLVALL